MSKWSEEFITQFKETGTVRRLTDEIKRAFHKKKMQRQVDIDIGRVCRGEVKRRGY